MTNHQKRSFTSNENIVNCLNLRKFDRTSLCIGKSMIFDALPSLCQSLSEIEKPLYHSMRIKYHSSADFHSFFASLSWTRRLTSVTSSCFKWGTERMAVKISRFTQTPVLEFYNRAKRPKGCKRQIV